MRWTRAALPDGRWLAADGEVVWSWHPDAGVKLATMLAHRADDGGKKARSPRRVRRKPLKPSRRECRLFRRTCGDLLVCFLISHARLWVRPGTRHSLRPLISGGRRTSTRAHPLRRGRRGRVSRCHYEEQRDEAIQRCRWILDAPPNRSGQSPLRHGTTDGTPFTMPEGGLIIGS